MSNDGSRKDFSEPFYFFIFVVSPILLVLLTLASFLCNALWTIGFALPFVIVMPIWFYIDRRVNRQLLRSALKFTVVFTVFAITITSLTLYWMLWTSDPLPFWTIFVYVCWIFFITTISSQICERFQKPKLESNQVNTKSTHSQH